VNQTKPEKFRKRKNLKIGGRAPLSAVVNEMGEVIYVTGTVVHEKREVIYVKGTVFGSTICLPLLVPEARALRDWLNKVLPEEKS